MLSLPFLFVLNTNLNARCGIVKLLDEPTQDMYVRKSRVVVTLREGVLVLQQCTILMLRCGTIRQIW